MSEWYEYQAIYLIFVLMRVINSGVKDKRKDKIMTKPIQHKSFKAEFKAGTYFIGDPCYALRDDLYEKWGTDNNYDDGDYEYFAVGSTAYGDGTYEDIYSGKGYGVDAGILGVVNMDYADTKYDIDFLNKLGKVITVEKFLLFEYDHQTCTFIYTYDDNGKIEIEIEFEEEEDNLEDEY